MTHKTILMTEKSNSGIRSLQFDDFTDNIFYMSVYSVPAFTNLTFVTHQTFTCRLDNTCTSVILYDTMFQWRPTLFFFLTHYLYFAMFLPWCTHKHLLDFWFSTWKIEHAKAVSLTCSWLFICKQNTWSLHNTKVSSISSYPSQPPSMHCGLGYSSSTKACSCHLHLEVHGHTFLLHFLPTATHAHPQHGAEC